MKDDVIYRRDAVDALDVGVELLKRVLDDTDVVGAERKKYEWGLELIESCISDMKELPSAQPERLTDDDFEVIIFGTHRSIVVYEATGLVLVDFQIFFKIFPTLSSSITS